MERCEGVVQGAWLKQFMKATLCDARASRLGLVSRSYPIKPKWSLRSESTEISTRFFLSSNLEGRIMGRPQ